MIPDDDADQFAIALSEAPEQPTSLKDRGQINFIITPTSHYQVCDTQKDKIAVESTALSNSNFKCDVFNPILNEMDFMIRSI